MRTILLSSSPITPALARDLAREREHQDAIALMQRVQRERDVREGHEALLKMMRGGR